jgi:hypothetical protein
MDTVLHLRTLRGNTRGRELANQRHLRTKPRAEDVKMLYCSIRMSERETVVELPWAADSCSWVEKLRSVDVEGCERSAVRLTAQQPLTCVTLVGLLSCRANHSRGAGAVLPPERTPHDGRCRSS